MRSLACVILVFASLVCAAQKDLSIRLESPGPGIQIGKDETMDVVFVVSNNSSQTLLETDSTIIAFSLNGNYITFSGHPFFLIAHPQVAPGDTFIRNIPMQFGAAPGENAIFCISLFVVNQGFVDTILTNNVACVPMNVGLDELDKRLPSLEAYPNPCNTGIVFRIPERFGSRMQIYDLTGRRCTEQPSVFGELHVATAEYRPGVYVYRLVDEDGWPLAAGRFCVK
jgi:hypothetical protein